LSTSTVTATHVANTDGPAHGHTDGFTDDYTSNVTATHVANTDSNADREPDSGLEGNQPVDSDESSDGR
jgi:hypothetical protein